MSNLFQYTLIRIEMIDRVKALCRLISDRCEITVANQSILFFVD